MKKDEKLKIAEKARVYRAINRLTQAELGALTKTSQICMKSICYLIELSYNIVNSVFF
mgnify:CR=1 FL=1